MPILRGTVTFSRYRTSPREKKPADTKRWFNKALKAAAFEPLDRRSDEDRAAGFAELENRDSTDFAVSDVFRGDRALFAWRVDQLKIPSSQLKQELSQWAQAFEQREGRKPARSEKNEMKEQLRHQLRSRAVPTTKVHDLCWNLSTGELQIWAASRKVVDEIIGAIETSFEVTLTPHTPTAVAGESEGLQPTLSLVTGADVGVSAVHTVGGRSKAVVHGAA